MIQNKAAREGLQISRLDSVSGSLFLPMSFIVWPADWPDEEPTFNLKELTVDTGCL